MNRRSIVAFLLLVSGQGAWAATGANSVTDDYFSTPQKVATDGAVAIGGKSVAYRAIAGTLIVHAPAWDPAQGSVQPDPRGETDRAMNPPTASMFYVAYTRKGSPAAQRPVIFFWNGGPSVSAVWLHMGSFGPRRIITADHTHTPPGDYKLVNNDFSLLDVADLVFVDAPGTGFGHLSAGRDDRTFFGVDADADAFVSFIAQYVARFGRYASPKYVFGESYGTPRAALVAERLQSRKGIDLNGVIMLSQVLNYDDMVDISSRNPSIDQPYILVLPSLAAVAWYHHKLPQSHPSLAPLLEEVEQFALNEYANALADGNLIEDSKRQHIVDKLHQYTGLPEEYIRLTDLRIAPDEFETALLRGEGKELGVLDGRFAGYGQNPLAQTPYLGMEQQSAAIGSAYISGFNEYVRQSLHYGTAVAIDHGYEEYLPGVDMLGKWDFRHRFDGLPPVDIAGLDHHALNVMYDMAAAMKRNPHLRILLLSGYFDLSTPYFVGLWEMRHLPIPRELTSNITVRQYPSGHMIYVNDTVLPDLHRDVAEFVTAASHREH